MRLVLQHLLESSVILGILILYYRLILHQQSTYRFNRLFLLISLCVSAIIPFMHIANFLTNGVDANGVVLGIMIQGVNVYSQEIKHVVLPVISQNAYMQWIYLIGAVLLLIRLIYGLIKIGGMSQKGAITKQQGFSIAYMSGRFNPFSFFRIIFVNRALYSNDDLKQIIAHEKAHIQFKHSVDVLLMEALLIAQWFNPFAWIARKLLKELHEFQADKEVLKTGVSISQYKMLLLFQASGARLLPVNNFNDSITKKRFKMMNSNNINKKISLRIAFSVVILACTGFLFAFDNVSVSADKYVNNTNSKTKVILDKEIATMPEYPGGDFELRKFIARNVKYPVEAQKGNIQGKVYVQFIVNKKGNVQKIKVIHSVNQYLDKEALRVVNKLGNVTWTPGKDKNGQALSVKMTVPIQFVLQEGDNVPVVKDEDVEADNKLDQVVVVGYNFKSNIDSKTLKN